MQDMHSLAVRDIKFLHMFPEKLHWHNAATEVQLVTTTEWLQASFWIEAGKACPHLNSQQNKQGLKIPF